MTKNQDGYYSVSIPADETVNDSDVAYSTVYFQDSSGKKLGATYNFFNSPSAGNGEVGFAYEADSKDTFYYGVTEQPNNAKIHTDEQIEQIKKSIEQFGFNDPIAVWKDNEIIEGHGRWLAAVQMGIKNVPIIRLDDLTDSQRKAYMLAHNKLTMNTGFDFDLLSKELDDIIDFDMSDFGVITVRARF